MEYFRLAWLLLVFLTSLKQRASVPCSYLTPGLPLNRLRVETINARIFGQLLDQKRAASLNRGDFKTQSLGFARWDGSH